MKQTKSHTLLLKIFRKVILKTLYIFLIVQLFNQNVYAQPGRDGDYTVSTTRTVINRYTRAIADIPTGGTTITVSNINELAATGPALSYINTTNFDDPLTFLNPDVLARTIGGNYANDQIAAGDLIMLYQAQGAVIDVSNAISYGNVTDYNGAGQYEFFFVSSVAGNTITLNCATRNNYFVAKYVQVIRIPQYNTLTINGGASISATPWGSPTFAGTDASAIERRRGGVVGSTANNIINNGVIEANGSGFRGGVRENFTSPQSPTVYAAYVTTDAQLGGEKGESIAGFRRDYGPSTGGITETGAVSPEIPGSGVAGRYGRGAPANGGGGGNAHNAGGGGGANGNNGLTWFRGTGVMNDFTGTCGNPGAWVLDVDYIANGNALTNSSGGGRGGYTFGSADRDACTEGPTDADWGGDLRDPVGGLGGRPLDYSNNERLLYLGGGGGAGDGNNNASNDGGNGGGMVFLVVLNSITGTGTISANGNNAPNTFSAHNDAPGGGGGGGTVIIKTKSIANTITINANGGNGGNQLITVTESEGPGGGGGGGYIAIGPSDNGTKGVAANPTKSATGGVNGTSTSTAVTEFRANGATSGATGVNNAIISNYFVPYEITVCYYPDLDGDGLNELDDIDDDNDGIRDIDEMGGATNYSNDNNGNSALDYQDPTIVGWVDANFDGVLDFIDKDNDGVPNHLDLDSDNDGIFDVAEAKANSDTRALDANNDGRVDGVGGTNGWPNAVDNIETTNAVLALTNTDGDVVRDFLDLDSDNDGINDVLESGISNADPDGNGIIGSGAIPAVNTSGILVGSTTGIAKNTDGDTAPDYRDLDTDNDGITDVREYFASSIANPDINGDGIVGNNIFTDADADGILDITIEAGVTVDGNTTTYGDDTDYVPANTDGTGGGFTDNIPDYRDLDSDNDSMNDVIENQDTNGNTVINGAEVNFDTNGDGMVDGTDTDGDGILGLADSFVGFGDNRTAPPTNTDGDGQPNFRDLYSNDATNLIPASRDIAGLGGVIGLGGSATVFDSNNDGKIDGGTDPDNDGIGNLTDGLGISADFAPLLFGDLPNNPACNPASITLSTTANNTTVALGSSAIITITGGLTYTWRANASIVSTSVSGNTITVTPTVDTWYVATATTAALCQKKDSILIRAVNCNPALVTLSTTANITTVALGSSATITITGGATYTWKTDPTITSTSGTGNIITVSPTVDTWYVATATFNGICQKKDSILIRVSSSACNPALITLVTTADNPAIVSGGSATITITGGLTYTWRANPSIISTSPTGNTITVTPTVDTWYVATATTSGGCQKMDSIRITVINDCEVFLPNLFSPNADGNNDNFIARGLNISTIDFRIFDRAGNLMYRTTDVNEALNVGWNGRSNSSDQPIGMYIWTIEGFCFDGKELSFQGKKTGKVNLIR